MLNKISIKTKLLLYGISIQTIVFIIFSYTLYKSLEISTIDKIQSNLNIIIFDIRDDLIEHSSDLINVPLNEEDEYKYKPLYIRILEIKQNSLSTIKSTIDEFGVCESKRPLVQWPAGAREDFRNKRVRAHPQCMLTSNAHAVESTQDSVTVGDGEIYRVSSWFPSGRSDD